MLERCERRLRLMAGRNRGSLPVGCTTAPPLHPAALRGCAEPPLSTYLCCGGLVLKGVALLDDAHKHIVHVLYGLLQELLLL